MTISDHDHLLWLVVRVLEGRAVVNRTTIRAGRDDMPGRDSGCESDISITCLDYPFGGPPSPIRFEIMLAMLREEFQKLPPNERFSAAEQAMVFFGKLADQSR